MPSLLTEHQQWFDETTGVPINNGYIYIGTLGLDPTVLANQITIYSDAALTTAIDNPQRTGADGRSVNKIYIPNIGYSIEVQDSAQVQKYKNLSNNTSRDSFKAEDYGAIGDGVIDDSTAINDAITTLSGLGGGFVELDPQKTYLFSSAIVMKKGVTLGSRKSNMIAATTYSDSGVGLPTLKSSAIAVDAITMDSDQTLCGLEGVKIDLSSQTAGNGVVFDDAAGTLRPGQFLKNVHIYEAFNKAVQIDTGNKEGRLLSVYCRCGANAAARTSSYGVYYQSVDWYFEHVLAGFATTNGLVIDGGGAGRFMYVDVFGCGDYGGSILNNGGANWFYRYQSNTNEKGSLKINATAEQRFVEYTTVDNSVDTTTDHDIFITGNCPGTDFTHSHFRGSSNAPATYYVFKSDDPDTKATITGGYVGTSYTDIGDATVRANFSIQNVNWRSSRLRIEAVTPQQHNTNPHFTTYTTGIPDDWASRGSATAAQITTSLPDEYTSGVRVTSGASTVSGIQIALTAARYAGQRVRISGWFKRDGTAGVDNQVIQIFDGVTDPTLSIDSTSWKYYALEHVCDSAAANIQARILASVSNTTGLTLDCTGVKVETY